jgi:hypothetical protein
MRVGYQCLSMRRCGFGGRPLEDTSFLDGSSFRSPGPDLTVD